jgi:superfamily II DNA or RNA helicase
MIFVRTHIIKEMDVPKKTNLNKYLDRRGYVVRKNSICSAEEDLIRKELQVTAFKIKMFKNDAEPAKTFKVFRENSDKFYLPKFYGINKFGGPEFDFIRVNSLYERIVTTFTGNLREKQQSIADHSLKALDQQGGGLLELPCGFGKTVLAIYLIAALGFKAMVVVHKEFLMNQWRERIKEFMPTAKIGILQQNCIEVEGKDIVIGMLQSISMRDYPPELFNGFATVCFDECHHLGAEVFSRALLKLQTRYVFGLSATPNRTDGLSCVFQWHIGPTIFRIEDSVNKNVKVEVIEIENKDEVEAVMAKYSRLTPALARVYYVSFLVVCLRRNEQIVQRIVDMMREEPGRRVLVLSERRGHLETLENMLCKIAPKLSTGFYWGGTRQESLDIASEQEIIFGTFQMASEGMDIPELNTVFLTVPKADVKQSVGRILRKKDHVVTPTIVDVMDVDFPGFVRQYKLRKRMYKKSGFAVPPKRAFEKMEIKAPTVIDKNHPILAAGICLL